MSESEPLVIPPRRRGPRPRTVQPAPSSSPPPDPSVPQPHPERAPNDVIPRPRIEVFERGLQNVFGMPSAKIELKDPAMETHWCNTAISGTQLVKYLDAGYLKVRPEMLLDHERVSFTTSPEGYVTRGARHEEILLYTLKDWYRQRQREKTRINLEGMRPDRTKTELVEATGKTLGSQTAEYLDTHLKPIGGIKDSHERIEVVEEEI